jgi:uncharacterized membrane protein YobD (UPF0266 family)
MQTSRRLGAFLILVGLVLLILFFGSVMSQDAKTNYLLLALVALFLGVLLQRNKESKDSGRFSSIRRASAASRQRREDQEKNKSKK